MEIKAGSAPSGGSLKGLRQAMADLSVRHGFVVYRGRERIKLGGGVMLVPWTALDEAFSPLPAWGRRA